MAVPHLDPDPTACGNVTGERPAVAIDPSHGAVFPRGLPPEPFPAPGRADIGLITRTEPGRAYQGLTAEIRRHNATVPVFLARIEATAPPVNPLRRAPGSLRRRWCWGWPGSWPS